jgi:hypothetical protein
LLNSEAVQGKEYRAATGGNHEEQKRLKEALSVHAAIS